MGKLLNFIIKTSIVLAVFLVPLVWSPWTFEAFEFPKQYLLVSLVVLGLFAWLAKMVLVEGEVHVKKTPLNLPILLFVLVALLSGVFSADAWSSLFGTYGRFSDGLFGLLSAVGLYFLAANTVQKPSSLVRPFLISSAIVVVIGYLSLFGALQQFPVGFNPVAGSVEGFSIFVAFLVSFLALLSVRSEINPHTKRADSSLGTSSSQDANSEAAARSGVGVKQLPFAGNLALLFLSLGILLVVNVPKAWLVLLLGLLLALLSGLFQRVLTGQALRLRRLWLPMVLLLFTVIFLFSPAKVPGLVQQFPQESMLSQEASWSIAFKTLSESKKNLVLGSGPGTFALDFSKHKPSDLNTTPQWQTRFDRSGSHLTEVLSTTGILGFLSLLVLIFWFFMAFLFFAKSKKSLVFLGAVLLLFLAQLVYYQTAVLQVLFWLFLALSVVSWELGQREFRLSLRRFPEFNIAAKALLLLLFLGAAAVFFSGTRFFIADMNYFISQNTPSAALAARIDRALEASRLNPWQAEYKMFLSRLYLGRAQRELRKPEGTRDQEQISKDVKYAIAYTRGDSLEQQKITGAAELSPNRVEVWETLGAVYRDIASAVGALDWGIRSFETAISLEPANPVLHTELGKLYSTKEEFGKAREHLEKAVEVKPDYGEAHLELALLKEKEGDVGAALAAAREVNLRYPLNVESAFQLGRLLYNAGQVDGAISSFEQVLRVAPNHSNALFALGVAYESQGRIEEALGEFEKVLQLNPDNKAVFEKLQELRK